MFVMKNSLRLLVACLASLFASCVQDYQNWRSSDPNDGVQPRALEGWEERDKTGESSARLSGEVSLGVRSSF